MPHFITDTCIGCGVCEIKCPTHTITGDKDEKYVIHHDRCIDCSVCARYCPVSCIQDQKGELVEKVKPKDIPKAIVDRDLCTGCEFCIDICPFDCIYLIDDPLHETFHKIAEVDAGPCVSCRLCETVCDKDAIFVPNPDHPGEAVPARPVTEPPKDAPPQGDEEFTEEPRGAGKLIVRFFLLPLVVVVAAVGIFLVFNSMTFERRGPRDYLQEVRGGAANRRWQAAFELSRSLGNLQPEERASLTAETLRVFETLSPKRPDDLLVRRYLVLVLGRLGEKQAVPALIQAASAEDPDTRLYAIWALGKIGDPRGVRDGPRLVRVRGRGVAQDGRLRARGARRSAGRPAVEGARRRPGRRRALERGDRPGPARGPFRTRRPALHARPRGAARGRRTFRASRPRARWSMR